MIGFAVGGVLMGRLADRFGIAVPLALGDAGARRSAMSRPGMPPSLWQFALAHGLLIGVGCSATLRAADRRHLALVRAPARHRRRASRPSGNYLAGTIWPPVVQHFIAGHGWRATHIGIGAVLLVTMLPLALAAAPAHRSTSTPTAAGAVGGAPAGRAAVLAADAAGAAVHRRRRLLRGDVDAAGAYRRLLRRSRLRRGARRRDAVADARLRHRQPPRLRLHRRPHRRRAHAAARLGAARRRAAALSVLRRADLALRDLGAVRPVPGRHRAELRHHRARVFFAAGGRHPRRPGADGDAARHGAGRLDVGRDLRPDRLLPGGIPQRDRLEPAQHVDHDLAAAALARPAGLARA